MKTSKVIAALCSVVLTAAMPFGIIGRAAAVNVNSALSTMKAAQAVSQDISEEIGIAANLFCIEGSNLADHGAIQWATTLDVSEYVLYRSESSDSGFVPIYRGLGRSYEDDDMEIGKTYYYQLSVSDGETVKYSSVKELTPCEISDNLNVYDNQKGSSLVYETSGFKSGDKYYSYALRTHAGTNDIYLAESVSSDGRNFGAEKNVADSSQNSDLASCKIESVHIEYVKSANKVIVWAHWEKPSGYNDGKALVITGTPGGQFTVHHVYNPLGIQVRDMAVFFDDDAANTGYLIAAANKDGQGANATIYIFKMNEDYSDVTEIVKTLHEDQYREFPNLIKKNGYYFLFTSQAAGWYPSSGAYTVTDNLYGEWSELREIGNTSTFSSQSGWIVNLQDKNYLMHAYRWLRGTGTSGTTLCPLYFDNSFAFYDYYPNFRYSTKTGELYPVQKGELLSQDKTATASIASKIDASAQKAVDGNYRSSFTAIGDFKKWPFYIQIDLENVCDLKNIQTSWYICKGSEGYYTYTIEGSMDGINWTTLLDRTDKNDDTITNTYGFNSDMLSGKARYIRLNVKNATLHNNPNNNWYTPTVYEVKVYGTPISSGTAPSPAVSYDFETANGSTIPDISGNNKDLKLSGNASVSADAEKGNVLQLDGTENTFAELPAGLLDGCTDYTIVMDAKSESEGDFFTFAAGQDNIKYSFFKIAKDHFRFATSTDSWGSESGLRYDLDGTKWHRYVFTVNGASVRLYIDGALVSETTELTSLVADMGTSLKGYIGKSFYEGDLYFNGSIDNLSVYKQALNPDEVKALGSVKGDVNADGKFSVADLVLLNEYLLGKSPLADYNAADLHEDNVIDVYDMILMRQEIVK